MSYTYVINKNPTGEDLKTLCKRIDELCPGYERAGGRKYADGAENVRWEKGQLAITAELEAAPAVLTVCSDEALPALEREYRLLGREQKKRNVKDTLRYGGWGLRDLFFGTFARVKFIFLPCLFGGIVLVLFLLSGGFPEILYTAVWVVMGALTLLAGFAVMLGWVWLIPAGAAAVLVAEKKSSVGVKLIVTALPVISIAYGCRWYGVHEYLDYIYTDPLSLLMILVTGSPVIYLAALPYMIIDEVACRRLMTVTGARPRARVGVLCWAVSFLLSLALMAAANYPEFVDREYFTSERYYARMEAERRYDEARRELIYMRYSDDISDIARYAAENNYYNWTECPDRSVEEQWRRVFLEAGADYRVTEREGCIVIAFPGVEYSVLTGGEEKWA